MVCDWNSFFTVGVAFTNTVKSNTFDKTYIDIPLLEIEVCSSQPQPADPPGLTSVLVLDAMIRCWK